MIISRDILEEIPEEVSLETEVVVDLESNEYRRAAGLPLLPSTSGQNWIDTAGKGSLRSQGLIPAVKSAIPLNTKNVANAPSKTFSQTLEPISNNLTQSKTFNSAPTGVKGSLPRANQVISRTAPAAKLPKVGDIIGQHKVGGSRNPLSAAALTGPVPTRNIPTKSIQSRSIPKTPKVQSQTNTINKNNTMQQKGKVIQTTNKANYKLKLIQIDQDTYRIDICDKFSIGSKPKASTGVLTKVQALAEFARIKNEKKM